MKYEVIWGIHLDVTRDHLHVRAQSAPPMQYRVNRKSMINRDFNSGYIINLLEVANCSQDVCSIVRSTQCKVECKIQQDLVVFFQGCSMFPPKHCPMFLPLKFQPVFQRFEAFTQTAKKPSCFCHATFIILSEKTFQGKKIPNIQLS